VVGSGAQLKDPCVAGGAGHTTTPTQEQHWEETKQQNHISIAPEGKHRWWGWS
jgi:hypothetical protein